MDCCGGQKNKNGDFISHSLQFDQSCQTGQSSFVCRHVVLLTFQKYQLHSDASSLVDAGILPHEIQYSVFVDLTVVSKDGKESGQFLWMSSTYLLLAVDY